MVTMTKKSLDQLRDFVRFTFKTYQDVIHTALTKGDVDTVKIVLPEFSNSLTRLFEQRPILQGRLEGYKFQLGNYRDDNERLEAEEGLKLVQERLGMIQNLALAKLQIMFGLAARGIDLFLAATNDKDKKLEMAKAFLSYLPTDMQKLVELFNSISDERASDAWGWHWWDLNPDGEVHFVDTFTRPNRTFIVQALKILAGQGQVPIPVPSDDSAFTFDSTNQQGVGATLTQMEADWAAFGGIVGDGECEQAARLRAMFESMKKAAEEARERKLIAAPLDPVKIDAFHENVAAAFDRFSRMRLLMEKLSKVNDRSLDSAPAGLHAWGYNQLDDKGAFITDWPVHYGGWGEAYGRGLAQAEDNRAFEVMLTNAKSSQEISENDIIPEITKHLQARKWHKPVILQTLQSALEYAQIRNRESFVPRYSRDLPSIPESEIDGFMGVLLVGGEPVPVFDIFVQKGDLTDKILITELSRYAEWNRYSPLDEGGPDGDVYKQLQIKVFDLNRDDDRRNKILQEAPDWLTDKGDANQREAYLRSRVVVNVYDKFDLKILNPAAAISLAVTKGKKVPEN
jgi:hypothetical protein